MLLSQASRRTSSAPSAAPAHRSFAPWSEVTGLTERRLAATTCTSELLRICAESRAKSMPERTKPRAPSTISHAGRRPHQAPAAEPEPEALWQTFRSARRSDTIAILRQKLRRRRQGRS
eukprot:Amastigsp_a4025_33.p3 type:complete len:119 gc:universal Amastigsp_a4025_33:274-630(+)